MHVRRSTERAQGPSLPGRFWIFSAGAVISVLGLWVRRVAVPLALLDQQEPGLAVLSVGVQAVPYLFSPLVGWVVDRYDAKRSFIGVELVQMGGVLALPTLLSADTPIWLFGLLAALGVCEVLSLLAADYSLIPRLVAAENLGLANSRFHALRGAAQMAGPAVGGLAVGTIGVEGAILFDSLTFGMSASAALVLPLSPPRPGSVSDSFPLALREGFVAWRRNRELVALTTGLTLYNFGVGALVGIVLLVARDWWEWSEQGVGLVLSAGAAAGSLGAFLASHAMRRFGPAGYVQACFAAALAGGMAMAVRPTLPAALIFGFLLLYFSEGVLNVGTQTLRQSLVPVELRGRVNATMRLFILGVIPLSAAIVARLPHQPGSTLLFVPLVVSLAASLLAWSRVVSNGLLREWA